MAMVLRKSRLRLTQAIYFGKPQAAAGTGTVTSVGSGTGITTTPNPIIGIGTVALTTPVSNANGGTGADTSATGGAGEYVKQAGVGAAFTVGTIPASDVGAGFVKVDGTTPLTADWNASAGQTAAPFGIEGRNQTNWFNVLAYGADPTGVADSTAKVQAAINAIVTAGYTSGTVYFPAGTYKIVSTLVLNTTTSNCGVTFRGEGWYTTFIKLPPALDGIYITQTAFENVQFYDIGFDTTTAANATAGAFIHAASANEFCVYMERCRFLHHLVGLQLNSCYFNYVTNNIFSSTAAAGSDIVLNNTVNAGHDQGTFFSNWFFSSNNANVNFTACAGLLWRSNKHVSGTPNYSILGAPTAGASGTLFIEGNSFESPVLNNVISLTCASLYQTIVIDNNEVVCPAGGAGIALASSGAGQCQIVSLTGNEFTNGATAISLTGAGAAGIDAVNIADNVFWHQTVSALTLGATTANQTNITVGLNGFFPNGAAYVSGTFSASSGFGFPGIFTKAGFNTVAPTREIDLNGTARSRGIAAPAVSELGSGTIYFDSGLNKYRVSMNGAAYVDLVGSAGLTGAGVAGHLPFWTSATNLSDAANIYVDDVNTRIGINVPVPGYPIDVFGDVNLAQDPGIIRVQNAQAIRFGVGASSVAVGINAGAASNSVAVGTAAMGSGVSGTNCTAVGAQAGAANTAGDRATAVGSNALTNSTSGTDNTAIGYLSGATNTTGSNNVLVGSGADVSAPNLTNAVAIGYQAVAGASNSMVLGNASMNVGIRTSTPALPLDVNGAFGTRHLDITLVNGLNSDIALTDTSFVRVIGPTGVFSLGGFTAGADGRQLIVYNTVAFQMTIVNEDGASTATNRIKTLTGANVVLRPGTSAATFIFDGTADRWILLATN